MIVFGLTLALSLALAAGYLIGYGVRGLRDTSIRLEKAEDTISRLMRDYGLED